MRAAVYEGPGRLGVRELPVPRVGPGELLVRVAACGICGTDLKKIAHGLQAPPRVYGHEFAGEVVAAGPGAPWAVGDRVAVYHHVPCRQCAYCRQGAFSQCAGYKRTGTTAGYEPAGGGWAQYVRVMDWIARDGVVRVPDGAPGELASLMEPLNTCLRCVEQAEVASGETVVILGQGPVGLMLTQICVWKGARVVAVDFMPSRLRHARRFGAAAAVDPGETDPCDAVRSVGAERGADLAIVAAPSEGAVRAAFDLTRPAGRVMLFAQTELAARMAVPVGEVCVLEKRLIGSYSSSIELNAEVARLLFDRLIPADELITHRFGLDAIRDAVALAENPDETTLKIVILPNREEHP
jgi:L-iditol 2-dehydrogenase